jgi:hypothetical protein
MQAIQIVKSKTINCNAIAAIVVYTLQTFGVVLSPEVVAAGMAVMNVLLRILTKKPLAEK